MRSARIILLKFITNAGAGVAQSVKQLGYWLDDRGLIAGRDKRFSLLQRVQNSAGTHPLSYPKGSFPRVKGHGREADHNHHLVPTTSPCAFMAQRLIT